MNRTVIPLKDRKPDLIFMVFFLINLFFVTYVVDVEQLTISDPYSQQQAAWPPAGMVKIIHSYGETFDPLLMARPQWWKDTIWLDVIFYGPSTCWRFTPSSRAKIGSASRRWYTAG